MISPLNLSLLLLLSVIVLASSVSVEDDLRISGKEKQSLDKFRNRVSSYLTHDYMRADIYLIRWLRARNFDLQAAEKMLLNHLNWRKINRMDTIDEEDWSYFEKYFAYSVDSVNKKGQPLLIISNEIPWDIRGTIIRGQKDKLVRWMAKMYEDVTRRIRELQAEGKAVTRFSMVNTLDNFNLQTAGCLQCLGVFTTFTTTFEEHYPETLDQMILVNTPSIFDTVLRVIQPLISPQTRRAFRLMGTNKAQWQAQLLKDIDAAQLPIDLGGTKED